MKRNEYNPAKIEKKWQKRWMASKIYRVNDGMEKSAKKEDRISPDPQPDKYYALDMFPYPSGEGLHVGHPKGYIATDIISRMKRMQGKNVLHPMGFDAFGLPAENYALKMKLNPAVAVAKNVKRFKKQLEILGFDYDWSREINTTDPKYYRWTQWIFLQLLKKGLAYESYEPINWCPSCKTGLANEDIENGRCERCGTPVEKKPMRQWVLKITEYADRLLKDLDMKDDAGKLLLDWPESIKEAQRNWIGRSEGALIEFKLVSRGLPSGGLASVEVFTTRPDTLFGVTYVVLAPEHSWVKELLNSVTNKKEVGDYVSRARNETEIERTDQKREKTGVELKGVKAVNPANNEEVPVWIADYVLADYGTGAVMAVPAHDERDWEFAKKFGLAIKEVIVGGNVVESSYVGEGELVNSGQFNGKDSESVKKEITSFVGGKWTTTYKLRDWVFSRQRYWGEPIPVVRCNSCFIKENKINCVILHGCPSDKERAMDSKRRTYNRHWIPWTKKQLEKYGMQVSVPLMPEPWNASYEKWRKEFEKNEVNGSTILVGHSCGNAFLTRWLGETKKHVLGLIMIAPWKIPHEGPEKGFYDFNIDRSINERVKNIFIFTSDNEETDGKKSVEIYQESLNAKLISLKDHGHYIYSDMHTEEFYELIETIKSFTSKIVPVPERDLPVKLPKVKSYEPTGTGESPLAKIDKWVNVKCPECKGPAKRETNTMPQWAGSSWYYLRYEDPKNKKTLVDPKKEKYWSPVDLYVGGAEHATRHLIYARFWHKFLQDIGVVSTAEPFKKLQNVGLIMGEDGRKMSKRFGNVVNPDDIVKRYGADTMRVYEMFMGPFNQQISWNTDSMVGARRFVERVWRLWDCISASVSRDRRREQSSARSLRRDGGAAVAGEGAVVSKLLNKTIKKVTGDIENLRFNTAVSALMIALNEMEKQETVSRADYESFLKLLAPFAPHVSEELWAALGNKKSIHVSEWPVHDPALTVEREVNIIVQVNGKVRDSFKVNADGGEEELKRKALELPEVKKWTEGKEIRKIIVVKGKLVSVVV